MAATPGVGGKTYIQVGKPDASYGTAVVPTNRDECISFNLNPATATIDDPSLYAGVSVRGIFPTFTSYKGSLVTRANYNGGGLIRLLASTFGTTTYKGDVDVAKVQQWTFSEGVTLPSRCIEVCMAGVPDVTHGIIYNGCSVESMSFKITAGSGAGAMGQFTFGLHSGGTPATGTSPAGALLTAGLPLPTVLPVLFKHGVLASCYEGSGLSAADVRIKSCSFDVKNSLDTERAYIGSAGVDLPVRNGFAEYTLTIEQEFQSLLAFEIAKNFSVAGAKPVVFFRDSSVIATSTFYPEMEFALTTGARMIAYDCSINGYGVPTMSMTWKGAYVTDGGGTSGVHGAGYVRIRMATDATITATASAP